MDPISLISGGAGGLTGPSSSASSDGTQRSPMNVYFGGNNSALLWAGVAVAVVLILKRKGR